MADEETFKITDRRGRARDEAPAAPAGPDQAARAADSPWPVSDATSADAGGARGAAPKLDLQALFGMFVTTALVNLGVSPDPASGQPHLDLDGAREAIDVLVLLRDKTAGNRTEHESRFLEEALYQLQMAYVSVARGVPPA
jgi:hypothetical protein